jgi:hypothetical protein
LCSCHVHGSGFRMPPPAISVVRVFIRTVMRAQNLLFRLHRNFMRVRKTAGVSSYPIQIDEVLVTGPSTEQSFDPAA